MSKSIDFDGIMDYYSSATEVLGEDHNLIVRVAVRDGMKAVEIIAPVAVTLEADRFCNE